jgi:hypothetical protein
LRSRITDDAEWDQAPHLEFTDILELDRLEDTGPEIGDRFSGAARVEQETSCRNRQ